MPKMRMPSVNSPVRLKNNPAEDEQVGELRADAGGRDQHRTELHPGTALGDLHRVADLMCRDRHRCHRRPCRDGLGGDRDRSRGSKWSDS